MLRSLAPDQNCAIFFLLMQCVTCISYVIIAVLRRKYLINDHIFLQLLKGHCVSLNVWEVFGIGWCSSLWQFWVSSCAAGCTMRMCCGGGGGGCIVFRAGAVRTISRSLNTVSCVFSSYMCDIYAWCSYKYLLNMPIY